MSIFRLGSILFLMLLLAIPGRAQKYGKQPSPTQVIPVGQGWAKTSVNAVIFRSNSVTSYQNTQYTAYYEEDGSLILARRSLDSNQWTQYKTPYSGKVQDAHNAISIAVDGNEYLHVAWALHNQSLFYARSKKPGGLSLTPRLTMTGKDEQAVTYPQFYRLDDGDLLFIYRDGSSGNGDTILNRYDSQTKQWHAVAHPLIDGEGQRNAYVNTIAIDRQGGWHLSWTWRETGDVATNHDIMYAYSPDKGKTWLQSDGIAYHLPITAKNAEVVHHIPQNSTLINQTSMTVTDKGEPVIATYWKDSASSGPQYHIIWYDGHSWKVRQVGNRPGSFLLSGGGTKRIPISRPQIIAGNHDDLYMIFRDLDRGGISVASSTDSNHKNWHISDIYHPSIGLWEPTHDPIAWKTRKVLYLFGQRVGQGDGETLEDINAQPVFILKWVPSLYRH